MEEKGEEEGTEAQGGRSTDRARLKRRFRVFGDGIREGRGRGDEGGDGGGGRGGGRGGGGGAEEKGGEDVGEGLDGVTHRSVTETNQKDA